MILIDLESVFQGLQNSCVLGKFYARVKKMEITLSIRT
jgi:hypothetical protein